MRRWFVRMGPHRFTVEAENRELAYAELEERLAAMGLERTSMEWEELEVPA